MQLFWLDGLLISASSSLVGSYLTLYALEFGATSSQIGLMSTIVSLASTIALLPGAQLAERWLGPKRMVLVFSRGAGQLVWAMFGALPFFLAGQPAVYGVLFLRAMRSFAVSASSSAWTALAGQIVPRQIRGKFFAARNIAKQSAALLIVPAAGWLIDYAGFPTGYQICFGLATCVGALAFWAYSRIPVHPTGDNPQTHKGQEGGRSWSTLSAKRNFWAYSITAAMWAFSMQLAAPFFSVYMVEELGATAGIVGTMSAVASLTALPGHVLFGRWLDRRGPKWTRKVSGLLIPFLAWGWLLVRGPWGTLPIYAGSGFLMAGYGLSHFNMLLTVTPPIRKTRHVAIHQTVVQSVAALAPLLSGLLVGRIGFLPVFVLSGCGRMLSTLLLMHFVREPRTKDGE